MLNSNRIQHFDVLRGFAVLGILIMNMPDFAFPEWFNGNPFLFEGKGVNLNSWKFNFIFLEGKMRGILSILFGASILLISSKKDEEFGISPRAAYYRRMLWLVFIMLFTSYFFLCFTTILYEYAVSGMLLYFLRNLKPIYLIGLAVIILSVTSLIEGSTFWESKKIRNNYTQALSNMEKGIKTKEDRMAINEWNNNRKDFIKGIKEATDEVLKEMKSAHSGYTTIFPTVAIMISSGLYEDLMGGIFETLATVLLGMGLFKTKFLKGELPLKYYLIPAIVFLLAGTWIGYVRCNIAIKADNDFDGIFLDERNFSLHHSEQFHRLLMIGGYISLFIFFVKKSAFVFFIKPLSMIGKMAISNYIFEKANILSP